jgi:4-amino-4-deoxy-L-arabinose transferase-like glycosyltransferase
LLLGFIGNCLIFGYIIVAVITEKELPFQVIDMIYGIGICCIVVVQVPWHVTVFVPWQFTPQWTTLRWTETPMKLL